MPVELACFFLAVAIVIAIGITIGVVSGNPAATIREHELDALRQSRFVDIPLNRSVSLTHKINGAVLGFDSVGNVAIGERVYRISSVRHQLAHQYHIGVQDYFGHLSIFIHEDEWEVKR